MKATNLLRSTLLSFTLVGCGTLVEPGAGDDSIGFEVANLEEPAIDGLEPSPLLIEAPRAATTSRSLFAMTFAANAPVADVLQPQVSGQADVVEQLIVTKTAEPVRLVIELTRPTGTFSRVLVSDVVRLGTQTNHVLCEFNNIATFDPRCDRTPPVARELPSAGTISTSQWKLRVIDEATSAAVGSCEATGDDRLACVLPAQAAASYRIVASANGFEDLWDGSPGLGQQIQSGVPFTGAVVAQREYLCWDWSVTTSAMYCAVRYEYLRYQAVDRARLEFDPVTIRITANGNTTKMASPALTWDAGDDDLPGR